MSKPGPYHITGPGAVYPYVSPLIGHDATKPSTVTDPLKCAF